MLKSSGTALKKYGGVLITEIQNELDTAANESLTVTVIKQSPISAIYVGAKSIVDQFGSVMSIPIGRLIAVFPANELLAVIVREFPSSSTKNYEISQLPLEFTGSV